MPIFNGTATRRGTAAALALAGVLVMSDMGPVGTGFVATAAAQTAANGYTSPVAAYRIGLKAYSTGNVAQAVSALEYAMEKGFVPAKLMLGRIYLRGQGLPHEPAMAFRYFREIADDHADMSPNHPASPYVAMAFVELGKFYQRGAEQMGLSADDERAADYFVHAASLFGNAEAQYLLARLYLKGAGVPKNVRLARHWLVSASKKGYAPAQAYLGQLLWQGRVLKRRPVKALALITLARVNARRNDREWIGVIYRNIVGQAQPKHTKRARAVVAKWRRVYSVRRRSDAAADVDGQLDIDEKARGIDVRPYTPGEGTEGDTGQIMASPSSHDGADEGARRQANSLGDRVRHIPAEKNQLGIMQGQRLDRAALQHPARPGLSGAVALAGPGAEAPPGQGAGADYTRPRKCAA